MKYTGVVHMHSTHSYDGKMSLPELKTFLVERDISFACMTEHTDELTREAADAFVAECRHLSCDTFVFVPGFEVPYRQAHILHIGATEFVCSFADETQIQEWRTKAPLVVLAHPVRNRFNVDDTMLDCIDGVEIWNQQYEGKALPRMKSCRLLSELRSRKSLLATGGLDLHRKEHFGSPMTTIELDAPEPGRAAALNAALTEAAILDRLKSGRYVFGTDTLRIDATEPWQGSMTEAIQSRAAIAVIRSGRFVNSKLKKMGLTLPKSLKKAVRSKV